MVPISLQQVDAILRERVYPADTETVPLEECRGRILRTDLRADRDFPPFSRSCMDGYALQGNGGASSPERFSVVREQAAGVPEGAPVGRGEAVRISTGAIVPTGCDRVVPKESAEVDEDGALRVEADPGPGGFIHPQGSDARRGEVLVSAGTVLTPAVIAVAATIGKSVLPVAARPRLGILATGREIVPVGDSPEPHQIRTSNGPYLQALLEQNGFSAELRLVGDEPAEIRRALLELRQNCSVILTTGGVSVGAHDFLPGLFQELGAECWFHGVRQKPGKPLWAGACPGGPYFFGLPGNPASTALCVVRHVLPWLKRSEGLAEQPQEFSLAAARANDLPLSRFFPARSESGRVIPFDLNTSGDFLPLLKADGWIEVPAKTSLQTGDKVAYFPL
ncbi:MAG: molybdopterin molybdotransferase MoeA [Opitutales bacterium]|nr:molybdopterin molybdotransferase MoeA [Opitutales bacterium]MCH8540516.1 molybdopterin molybdotransferase MoeA [Opitutales bacterium]